MSLVTGRRQLAAGSGSRMPDYRLPESPPDEYAPVVPFDWFMTDVFDWRQDQHVGVIGPTEQGKSNLTYHLLQLRSYVAYMGI